MKKIGIHTIILLLVNVVFTGSFIVLDFIFEKENYPDGTFLFIDYNDILYYVKEKPDWLIGIFFVLSLILFLTTKNVFIRIFAVILFLIVFFTVPLIDINI